MFLFKTIIQQLWSIYRPICNFYVILIFYMRVVWPTSFCSNEWNKTDNPLLQPFIFTPRSLKNLCHNSVIFLQSLNTFTIDVKLRPNRCSLSFSSMRSKRIALLRFLLTLQLTQWSGKVMLQKTPRSKQDTYTIVGLLGMVRPMQSTPILEIRLDGNMFMSRHDLAMTFTYCDSR